MSRLTGISIPTLRRWITDGNCPPYRQTPTGILLFKRVEVERWFDHLPGVNDADRRRIIAQRCCEEFRSIQERSLARQVLNHLGISINNSGKISCLNPDHDDKNPSCHVYNDHVHCFGCGFRQDVIGLVRRLVDPDFWIALDWIADRAGLPKPDRDPASQERYEALQSISETSTDSLP